MGLYERELRRNTFQSNIILEIDGVYYSQYQPDGGLVIDDNKVGTIINISTNPITVDFRDVKTSFSTLTFTLLDKDNVISDSISNDPFAWQNAEVKLYVGFVTGSFPFVNYNRVSVTRIKSFTKNENSYTFKAEDAQALIKRRIYTTYTDLTDEMTDAETTSIDVTDTTDFPASGIIKIGDEYISYSGKTATSFTGLTRAGLNSEASSAEIGELVYEVTTLQDESMDILLDILLNHCNIPAANIDSAAFTALKAGAFVDEPDYKFYMANIENALTWIEENILVATNTRLFVDNNGKISIALLDQVVYADEAEIFSEDYQTNFPGYTVDSTKIANTINVYTDYQPGSDKFLRVQTFTEADSVAKFGTRELNLELRGVYTIASPSSSIIDIDNDIAPNRATRLLLRLAYPRAEISTNTFFSKLDTAIGDQVYFSHRFLPQPGSAIEFNQLLEVVSKAPVNLATDAQIQWKLAFTSYTGFRIPLISPSPIIETVLSQKKVVINSFDAAALKVGYKMQLQDNTTREVYADAANVIAAINGTEITFTDDFATTLTTDILLTFPNYDDSTEEQRAMFCYICDDDNVFDYDSKPAYLIVV